MAATLYQSPHKQVATWLSLTDYQQLGQLAQANRVSIAAYVRAIIVDAIQEESCISKSSIQLSTATSQVV